MPLHIVIGATMVSLLLALVFAVGYLTLNSATKAADQLVGRLHQEISDNINLRLDAYLEAAPRDAEPAQRAADIGKLLARLPIAEQGLAMLVDADGKPITGTRAVGDPTVIEAVAGLRKRLSGRSGSLAGQADYFFLVVTAEPLSRENWLDRATRYSDKAGKVDWVLITAMPESYYLARLREGSSQTAMLTAVALVLALLVAGLLAGLVATPLQRIVRSIEEMANGKLAQHAAPSWVQELDALARAFNRMAAELLAYFRRSAVSEQTLKTGFNASPAAMAVFDSSRVMPDQLDLRVGMPIVDANSAWLRVTGHRHGDVIASPAPSRTSGPIRWPGNASSTC